MPQQSPAADRYFAPFEIWELISNWWGTTLRSFTSLWRAANNRRPIGSSVLSEPVFHIFLGFQLADRSTIPYDSLFIATLETASYRSIPSKVRTVAHSAQTSDIVFLSFHRSSRCARKQYRERPNRDTEIFSWEITLTALAVCNFSTDKLVYPKTEAPKRFLTFLTANYPIRLEYFCRYVQISMITSSDSDLITVDGDSAVRNGHKPDRDGHLL